MFDMTFMIAVMRKNIYFNTVLICGKNTRFNVTRISQISKNIFYNIKYVQMLLNV